MFAEMYDGENAYLARLSKEEFDYKQTSEYVELVELIKKSYAEMSNILDNQICSLEKIAIHSNKEDKYFCQRTTCENCGQCDVDEISNIRIYLKSLESPGPSSRTIINAGGARPVQDKILKTISRMRDMIPTSEREKVSI